MTERGKSQLTRDANTLQIGRSTLGWDGGALTVTIDEMAVPWPRRLRGTVRIEAAAPLGEPFHLDDGCRHRWTPLSPRGRADVRFAEPAWSWQGDAYVDANAGDRALEDDFASWHWARADLSGGSTVIYDTIPRHGAARSLALRFTRDGEVSHEALLPRHDLPATGWRIGRSMRADGPPRLQRTLENTPFYARSLIGARLFGEDVVAMHESLSLDRFRRPWVQAMLPFRMPRRVI